MNALRSKKVRYAMGKIMSTYGENIMAACQAKLDTKNIYNRPQHCIISPKRQVKKMVLREKIA